MSAKMESNIETLLESDPYTLTKNEKDFYIAEGLWGVDNKKEQKEFIQVKLIPKK